MKIAPTMATRAPTSPPEYKLGSFEIRPAVGMKLQEYLKQNPSQLLIGGPLSRAAVHTDFKLGQPLPLGTRLNLRPLASSRAAEVNKPRAAPSSVGVPTNQIRSSVAKAMEVASLVEAFRGPVEELAKIHPGLDVPLDVLGFLVATPQVWSAITRPGPKSKVEICLASAQAGVWIAKVAADFIPAMQHAKPVLMWTGAILKAGDQVHAIVNRPEIAVSTARRP